MMNEYWAARDKDGWLCLYKTKPFKNIEKCQIYEATKWTSGGSCIGVIENDYTIFPDIKWENSPVKMEIFESDVLYNTISKIVTYYDDNRHPTKEAMEELVKKIINGEEI